jgi:23S rRNA pseudouridine1911/1915/1917 synthase
MCSPNANGSSRRPLSSYLLAKPSFAAAASNNKSSRKKAPSSSARKGPDGGGSSRSSVSTSISKKQQQQLSSSPRNNNTIRNKNRLLEPTVLFQNNHVLVVNKPAGWHSVPNDHTTSQTSKDFKCLLQKLKGMKLGGGSQQDFLLPMHRIDQPCTGLLVFAKNKKAGTRISTAWKKGEVIKEYWCVVQGQSLSQMKKMSMIQQQPNKKTKQKQKHSASSSHSYGYAVEGILKRVASANSRSVVVSPVTRQHLNEGGPPRVLRQGERLCHLEWDHVCHVKGKGSTPLELIRVRTKTGARHQVRAMLAQLLQSPIAGDLRYGTRNTSTSMKPLPDASVALHARSVFLPTVQLGGMSELLETEPFVSPLPETWHDFFGLDETQFTSTKRHRHSTGATKH